MRENVVREPCCREWARAHETGGYTGGSLICYEIPWPRSPTEVATLPLIGCDLAPVAYCPWCAMRKQAKREKPL